MLNKNPSTNITFKWPYKKTGRTCYSYLNYSFMHCFKSWLVLVHTRRTDLWLIAHECYCASLYMMREEIDILDYWQTPTTPGSCLYRHWHLVYVDLQVVVYLLDRYPLVTNNTWTTFTLSSTLFSFEFQNALRKCYTQNTFQPFWSLSHQIVASVALYL